MYLNCVVRFQILASMYGEKMQGAPEGIACLCYCTAAIASVLQGFPTTETHKAWRLKVWCEPSSFGFRLCLLGTPAMSLPAACAHIRRSARTRGV